MLRTRVGYAGGKKDKPTYRSIGDHTEALQIEFDPKVVSYNALLKVFWSAHDPNAQASSTQYKAVLWTHGKEQERLAKKSLEALTRKRGRKPTTGLATATKFWIAEDYHQKYRLRGNDKLLEALLGKDPSGEKVRESLAAARVNGWLSGYGTAEEIEAGVEALKLGEAAQKELGKALGKRAPARCR